MEKHLEAMRRSLELAETALTGLEHMKRQHTEGRFEEITILFSDVLSAFATIESSLQGIFDDQLSNDEYQRLTTNLRDAFELGVSTLENNDHAKLREILQFTLVPYYNKWKACLEMTLAPYLLS